jgi:LysM repeat protein
MKYIVRRGDTLSAIAQKYDTSVAILVMENSIKDKNKIYAGQTIVIPGVSLWHRFLAALK